MAPDTIQRSRAEERYRLVKYGISLVLMYLGVVVGMTEGLWGFLVVTASMAFSYGVERIVR